MSELDCKGLACPAPVLKTKELVEKESPSTLTVLVDNAAAKENVTRFMGTRGYGVSSEEKDGVFRVTGTREGAEAAPAPEPVESSTGGQKIMVLAATDRMGRGDDELGKKLMISFIKTLNEMGPDLWRLVLVNGGVKLAIGGSPVLADLKDLVESGVTLLVCGTCLTHFDLLEKKEVGETTNMLDIVTAMQLADKVVSL